MRNLASPKVIKEILNEYKFRFSKSLGQNFLIDENALDSIIAAADLSEKDAVLEIGPGFGTLTQRLVQNAGKVLSVEIDKTVIPILKENLSGFDNFKIVNDDIMKIDLKKLIEDEFKGYNIKAAANLPYYITTPILMLLLESRIKFSSLVIMVQKEVAQRLCAKPGKKDYGAITVCVDYFADASIVCDVPPSSFMPSPKVTSSVVKLTLRDKPKVNPADEKLFFDVVKAAFSQRRKTLLNALSNYGIESRESILSALDTLQIDSKRRGETLSIEEFAKISDIFAKKL